MDAAVSSGLTRIHREFADGEGRLARDLDATAERASSAAVRGVDRELDDLLGGCDGLDRRDCLRREVRALGKQASMGFVDGILQNSAWIAGLVFFLAGAAAAVLARALFDHLAQAAPRTKRS